MGTDVLLYAELTPTTLQFLEAEDTFRKYSRIAYPYKGFCLEVDLDPASDFDKPNPRVEVHTLARYFSEHNNRGWWPQIYHDIRLLQSCFPNATIFYGGDSSWSGMEVTEEWLESLWAAHYKREKEKHEGHL